MEPLHPDMSSVDVSVLACVILGLWLVVLYQIIEGLWDKFFLATHDWFPLWPWGG